MAALVTLEHAKAHLNIVHDAFDEEIERKAEDATAIVIEYLKGRADATWDETTVPGQVRAAVLFVLTHLFSHRGDDMSLDDAFWNALGRLLWRSRDPALA